MKRSTWSKWITAAAVVTAALSAATRSDAGRYAAHVSVASPVNVQVWVDGGDVFPDYDQVTVWLRADRDCYSSLFLVDTAGYIHVLYPHRGYDDGWVSGGRTYCFRACDLGLERLDGCGIAYVFAVGSPVRFDYSPYGDGVFVGGFGYRVYGDPFVACRDFYASLLPVGCRRDYVGVGFTRFYVRQWVRYPSYLCFGGPGVHVRVGDACRTCADVYASYRCNVAAPYEVIRPTARFKQVYPSAVRSARLDGDYHARRAAYERATPGREAYAPIAPGPEAGRFKPVETRERMRVVSTSQGFARGRDEAVRVATVKQHSRTWSRNGAPSKTSVAPQSASRPEPKKEGVTSRGAREKGAKKKVRQAQ